MATTQIELDELSRRLAPLTHDELCVAIVNSRIDRGTTPMLASFSFINLIGTLSSMLEHEQDRDRIATAMRDAAELIGRKNCLLN